MAQAGDTEIITAFITNAAGNPNVGLSPTMTLRAKGGTNNGLFLQADDTWAAAAANLSMVEANAIGAPGQYDFSFTLPSDEYDDVSYVSLVDGGATASPRYAVGEIEAETPDQGPAITVTPGLDVDDSGGG